MHLFIYTFLALILTTDPSPSSLALVWSDEFNTSEVDLSKWTIIEGDGCPELCGFGNQELQHYASENITLDDGILKITARKEQKGQRAYSSGKLVSKGKGDWKYGKVVVRARLPQGTGTWPAIWMLPTLDRPLNWPRDGEIDIMEHVGYNQGMVYGTIHTEKYNHAIGTHISDSIYVQNVHEEFHDYAVFWDEQIMIWSVDGTEYARIAKGNEEYAGWPFDQEYHLIINLAVGGAWGGKMGVDDSIWPQSLEIDYVKVYQPKLPE
ncbi:glycoside hydrolase family 16 protein [Marinoscillum furvescens]|uniref:Glycosyl hydrolase family 16 n=1 Tax=Marinoscillum furvescens DSM 4134 TaxID=1122208 RepID=A0A3D9L433_MARFU|nr:glycoside hydrolase family 16 protein [Marinoscillum furvescens]RED97407.1 glycosyl hydrolase family 16 [Marinoscillum furvescens DSM 4134]